MMEFNSQKLSSIESMDMNDLLKSYKQGNLMVPPPFTSWNEAGNIMKYHHDELESQLESNKQQHSEIHQNITLLDGEINELTERLNLLKEKRTRNTTDLESIKLQNIHLPAAKECINSTIIPITKMQEVESKLHDDVVQLIHTTPFEQITIEDMNLVLCEMNLQHYYPLFVECDLKGEDCMNLDEEDLLDIGLSGRDACLFLYHMELMKRKIFLRDFDESEMDCPVCSHTTIDLTLQLLEECNTTIDVDIIKKQNWTIPCLITCSNIRKELGISMKESKVFKKSINIWKDRHQKHLLEHSSGECAPVLFHPC